MDLGQALKNRSGNFCELCTSGQELSIYDIPPAGDSPSLDRCVYICQKCRGEIERPDKLDINHWRCLNETMWSEHPPVQVMCWRILKYLNALGQGQDLIEQLYLDEETLAWAKSGMPSDDDSPATLDSNGVALTNGDSVTLIKDLNVKGGGFTAKRGTLVKNISLTDDPKHIEGKVNGVQIVLVTSFLKKV